MKQSKSITKKDVFEMGHPINNDLISWLDANSKDYTFQLPVEIHCGPLGINSSFLRDGNTEIAIELDTSTMSLDLPMQLMSHCSSYPCKVWLEGIWGELIPGLPTTLPIFTVRKVIGVANEDDNNVRFLQKSTK